LRVDGGLVRSREFVQLQANLLGVPIEVLENPEATVMGVCYLAARLAGIWESDQAVLDRVEIARTVFPDCDFEFRKALISRFDQACHIVKDFGS